jgi:hypothetical protein
LGEYDAGYPRTGVVARQAFDHLLGVSKRESLECAVGKHAAPRIENHQCLRTGLDLCVQVSGYRARIDLQNAMQADPGADTTFF